MPLGLMQSGGGPRWHGAGGLCCASGQVVAGQADRYRVVPAGMRDASHAKVTSASVATPVLQQ